MNNCFSQCNSVVKNIFTDYPSMMVIIISQLDPYLETHIHTLKMDVDLNVYLKL